MVLEEDAALEEDAVEGEALAGYEDASDSLHWSEVNLDVDGDGAITKHDLEMALAANAVAESGGEETGDTTDGTADGEGTGDTGTEEVTDGETIIQG